MPDVIETDDHVVHVVTAFSPANQVIPGEGVVQVITALDMGPQGPPGEPGEDGADGQTGPQGPEGEPGTSGGYYVHSQGATSDTWVITHNLGYYPAITVVDSGGTTVLGEVTHDSVNQATVRFSVAFSGNAYAS